MTERPTPDSASAAALLCGNCSAAIPPGSHFCPECGAPVSLALSPTAIPGQVRPAGGAAAVEPAPPPAETPAVVPETPPRPARPRSAPPPPGAPPAPAGQRQTPAWLWLSVMIGAGLLALPLLFFGGVLLANAGEIAREGNVSISEARLVGLLCCLVPGFLLASAAVVSAVQVFRRVE